MENEIISKENQGSQNIFFIKFQRAKHQNQYLPEVLYYYHRIGTAERQGWNWNIIKINRWHQFNIKTSILILRLLFKSLTIKYRNTSISALLAVL